MSSASPSRRPCARRTSAGHTALEVLTAVAILSILALATERALSVTHNAERYLSGIRQATERGLRVSTEIREVVSSSRKLFQGDEVGLAYLEALDLHSSAPRLATLRMPLFDEVNGLGPDTDGDPRTGNALLFVRESDAAPTMANPATGKQRYIDTYRFVLIYPSETQRYIVEETDRKRARDLVFWRSLPFPSHAQIAEISDPVERANVVKDLYARFGYDLAVDPGKPVGEAFFAMRGDGTLSAQPETEVLIDQDLDMIERGKLVYGDTQLARTDNSSHARRAVFTVDDPDVWVPDGFEVKIVGASGSRMVWVHLAIEAQAAKGRIATHESTVIASTKDL